jgi:hypothetical protein
MKKITAEEFDNLKVSGAGSSSHFYNALLKLEIAEGLIILKSE